MSEFKCPRPPGKQKRQHMEHADARELRWRRGLYFYFQFTSAILFLTVPFRYHMTSTSAEIQDGGRQNEMFIFYGCMADERLFLILSERI